VKVLISGVEHFGNELAESLQRNDSKNKYLYLNIKTNIYKRLYFYFHLLTSDVLFVIYVDKYNMKSVDMALRLRKKVFLSWIGTDVLNALPRIRKGLFNTNYLDHTIHTTNSTWLQEELQEVGIKADYLTIFCYKNKERKINFPTQFSVLLYVPKGKEEFYGMNVFIKLAKELPQIQFKVVGISKYPNIPINIKLLGWVDMDKEYENTTVYIRYPQHDGEAHSVLEALSYGKIVFYNKNYPHVNYVKKYDELKNGLIQIYEQFQANELSINYEGIKYVKMNYEEKKVHQKYLNLFIAT